MNILRNIFGGYGFNISGHNDYRPLRPKTLLFISFLAFNSKSAVLSVPFYIYFVIALKRDSYIRFSVIGLCAQLLHSDMGP